jgi:hypothetical protein
MGLYLHFRLIVFYRPLPSEASNLGFIAPVVREIKDPRGAENPRRRNFFGVWNREFFVSRIGGAEDYIKSQKFL